MQGVTIERTVAAPTATAVTVARTRMNFHAEPLTFMARAKAFVMKPLMKKMVEMRARDLDAIKAYSER